MIRHSLILVLDECGEWSGLYIDGFLEYEGHNIYECDWIDVINKFKHFKGIESFRVSSEYLEYRGNLPSEFSDIPKECLILK